MLFGRRFHSWRCVYSPASSILGTVTVNREKRPSSRPKLSATCSGNCHGNRFGFGRMGVINMPCARKAESEYLSQMQARHRVLDPAARAPIGKNLCALAVMTKEPRAGQVKTRLVPPLSPEEAAQLNVCFLRDTADAIAEACGTIARGVGVYTPIGAEAAYIDILPGAFDLLPQRGDEFGERLAFAMEALFRCGFVSVCLIDSDSPTVSADVYADAVEMLSKAGDRVVLGPSEDGGYYLIGLKKNRRELFERINWST